MQTMRVKKINYKLLLVLLLTNIISIIFFNIRLFAQDPNFRYINYFKPNGTFANYAADVEENLSIELFAHF